MSDRKPPFKFTVNVPVAADIRFIDVRPGRMWEGKKLPSQVSIKGTFNGEDTIAFLNGPAWKNIKALQEGGVIDGQGAEIGLTAANDESLSQSVAVPVAHGKVTATLTKLAGDKYETMRYANGTESTPTKRIGSPYQGKAQPFDEPTEDERYAKFEKAIAELAGDEVADPYENAPAPAPIHNGTADLTQRAVNQYASVFALMDKALQKAYGAKVPPDTVQAATFSVWKRLSDKGVLS